MKFIKKQRNYEYSKRIINEKAQNGYMVCYQDQCPLRTQCLRWQVGQHVPNTHSSYWCVNPHFEAVETNECPTYRSDQKARFAKGMTHIFTSDMPKRVESAVRYGVIGLTNRTYYFEYRNGSRLIPPALQEAIRDLFRENGWKEEVQFDGYVEDYDW